MQSDADKPIPHAMSRRLFADQVHKQYEHTGFGTAATLINGLILVFVLRGHVQSLNLVVWLAGAGLVSSSRLVLHRFYRKSSTDRSNPQKWNAWFLATLFLSGVLWGSAAIFLFLLINILTANRMHKDILSLFALRYEKSTLIVDLQQEVEQRKAAQEDLRRQKQQVEAIVTQRTAELKDANQRLQAIITYAPLLIWAIDREGIFTFSDGKGMEKIGLTPGRAVGKSVFELFAENRPVIDITQRVLSGEFVSDTIHFKDLFLEVRLQPLRSSNDRLAGAIGIAIDVTEQTAAKEALRKSEEKYRELVENINDVMYAIDRRGQITYISPVIESVLGYRADELIEKEPHAGSAAGSRRQR